MKILIDDQYRDDNDKSYEANEYTVDENGNFNLFIHVDGEVISDNPANKSDNNNICNNELGEENILESDFIQDFDDINSSDDINPSDDASSDEKYSNAYDDFYSQIANSQYQPSENKNIVEEKGTIEVISKLVSKEGLELKGARINLYLLNGISPKLYDSQLTDNCGKSIFNNLENGCYRIIAIVDRRFFEKPVYYNWNEVTIDKENKKSKICVVNKIKPSYYKK